MNLKTFLLIICCIFYLSRSIAQKQNVYLYKNSGQQVYTTDSADYTRVITEPDDGTVSFNVKDYYKNGKVRMIGKSSKIYPIQLEGQCMSYFPSGKKKQFANYKEGNLDGDVYDYYPNGQIYLYKKYVSDKKSDAAPDYLILACNDSTGKELTINGNGHYIGYDNNYNNIEAEGSLKNGLKDGKWTGGNGDKKNPITFIEEYANGIFISGQSTDKDNIIVNYTVQDHAPQFKGGIKAFYSYLNNNIIYPINSRRNLISGRVFISFIVEKDGSITNAKITRSPNDELGAEALRVIKKSPKWEPGVQYGRVVRVQYSVPISFTLGG